MTVRVFYTPQKTAKCFGYTEVILVYRIKDPVPSRCQEATLDSTLNTDWWIWPGVPSGPQFPGCNLSMLVYMSGSLFPNWVLPGYRDIWWERALGSLVCGRCLVRHSETIGLRTRTVMVHADSSGSWARIQVPRYLQRPHEAVALLSSSWPPSHASREPWDYFTGTQVATFTTTPEVAVFFPPGHQVFFMS